ncbi:hypothetical protein BS78_05G082300 [Paspalum vaginatum]|nr:hypothetical protein BS78_05G082300 [Paspalum vaginatum]
MMLPAVGKLLFVLTLCSPHAVMSNFNGNYSDRLSLLEFKKVISDPQQALMSWNDSTHFCSWEGVLCSVKHPHRVTSLNLTHQGLVGPISPSLGNLTFLKILSLSANSFTGEIPPSLGLLHHLQYLYLINNTLQGQIPSFANCSELNELWLENNQLAGQIPADLPSSLQKLILAVNNLTGTIPRSLANMTMLSIFTCMGNNMVGNIPNEFAKLQRLQLLYVGMNKLSGHFPQHILNISSLMKFSVAVNNLSGDVPYSIGNSLPNLQLFELGANFFRGSIPSTLTNASKLYEIDISRNTFTGVVPSSIGKLYKLSWLNLEYNLLQTKNKQGWDFMDSLTNCTELQMFSAVGNLLEGNVPTSVGNLSNQLQYLHLAENQLSGDFPSGVTNLHRLIIVALEFNQFTGELPQQIGTLKSLQELTLGYNIFTGLIPSCLSNLSNLVTLTLHSNQFYGRIPPSLGNLQMLEGFYLDSNNLHGSIPKEIFRIPTIAYISLSFNKLDTPVHTDIGNAKQLTYFDIASNNISGEIPSTLGDCGSLEDINLNQNNFSGGIPTSLGNINGLQILNLSHNNLAGSIPESLVNLQLLKQLDLSFNQLEGEVPESGIFMNATAIHIDGNKGLCGGAEILHLPSCAVTHPTSTAKKKRSIALKLVIPLVSMVSLATMVIAVVLLCKKRKKRELLSLPSFGRKFPKVSYNDLSRATDGFSTSNLIGRGRYSSVYRGELFQDGNVVAVKVFSLQTRGVQKSFIAECNALRNVRHRNIVTILTACSSIDSEGNDFKALIYEFMPKGDLHKLLYSTGDDENSSNLNHITVAERLSIVVDVADAMEYLHHNSQGTIVHCDLKPSNILLDENMTAHVGDFGISRSEDDPTTVSLGDSKPTSSIAIRGTIGYVAPEYAGGGEVSTAADVYSFGVVLLEIFIRKRPTDIMFKDGLSIVSFAETNFPDRVLDIVDPQMLQEPNLGQEIPAGVKESLVDQCLTSVINIGLCCTKPTPSERIGMQEVAAKLHGIKDAYLRAAEEIVV